MGEQRIGVVTHYFGKIGVAAVEVTAGELRVGDTIRIRGHTSDFIQQVDSMQIEHQQVEVATPGQSVGMRVDQPAREHDQVFKVED